MKKIFLFLFAAGAALSAMAQAPMANVTVDTPKPKKSFTGDNLLPRFVLDINVLGGALNQNITVANTTGNYKEAVNASTNGNLNFTNGISYGFDGQVGFFFGHKRNFGIGTGFMYLFQQGDITLNNFQVDYQAVDQKGNIYRQEVVADNPVKEQIQTTNLNIPLLLKYKKRFSRVLGFTADAGVLFNVKESNAFNSNATFDYYAIYDYPNGTTPTVYDNSPIPLKTDVSLTKAAYVPSPTYGSVQNYFSFLQSQGYNVALNSSPNKNTGTVSYTTGSVGFLVRPALNFFLSDAVALNLGVFYLYQPFNNNVPNGYQLTNKVGDYSSVLNTVSSSANQSYGVNVGVRVFLGRKKVATPPMTISYAEMMNPTSCGASDGIITLHGLYPNQPVTVNYSIDGAVQAPHADVVSADGTVTLRNLSAGEYTGISASIGKATAMSGPKTLVNPPMGAISESATNPSGDGKCDGSIVIHGIHPRQAITVYYSKDGSAQPAVSASAGMDGTVALNGLCAGSYTHIVAASNTCSATGKDMTLVNMMSASNNNPSIFEELHKISNPILFKINKTEIQESSYSTLEEAAKMVNEDKTAYIVVDGYTDITGKASYNKALSVKRANAVKKQLEKMGVDPKKIKIAGHGSKSPLGDNSTPEGRMQNRRAVMHLNVTE
jgi:outer membrane protein OmpA-like peptidoglycan-associated protein